MTKFIECTMTVEFKYPLEDSRAEYEEEHISMTDDQVLALDKESVDNDLITMWDLDSDGKISYEWRIIDDNDNA